MADLELPFPPDVIETATAKLGRSVAGFSRHVVPVLSHPDSSQERPPPARIEEVGTALFQALFPAPVLRRWDGCMDGFGERPEHELRLVLKSDPACRATAALHRLPWELLRDPRTGAFLALSRRTQIVRQLALDEVAVLDPPRPARRLRILVVLSCPPGLDALDLPAERRKIEEAVRGRPEIAVTFVENPTFGDLTEALRRDRFHVLHYMGHGSRDEDSGQGYLLLAGSDDRPARVEGERLAQVVRDVDSLRLVVLNACETGRTPGGAEQPFTGLAHALIRSRVPAVLAMQLPIPDRAAIELSRVFYRNLAEGDAVDEALAEARVAVYASERSGGFGAWAIPVLFVRRPELSIFRPYREPEGVRKDRRWRRWLPLAAASLLAAAITALFFVRTPWTGVELEVVASGVSFTLAESQSVVDALDLVELAVPELSRLRHPDPAAGTDRRLSAEEMGSEKLGFLASVSGATATGLSLDDSCLPAGTRVELTRAGARDLRLSLDLPADEEAGCGGAVTASVGQGVTLRRIPMPSEAVDLGSGGMLVMEPLDHRIDLDLTLADAAAARFHAPLLIGDLEFTKVEEGMAGQETTQRRVSTLRSGKVTLWPLGGGKPDEHEVVAQDPVSLEALGGRITALELSRESPHGFRVHFRGRVDGITGRDAEGKWVDLMPTWSRSPWVVRLGAASSVLVVAFGLFGQLGGRLLSSPLRRAYGREAGPADPELD